MNRDTAFSYGYTPSLAESVRRSVAKLFVTVFGLNRNSKFSTEVCQLLKPKSEVVFEGQKMFFMSGHGRLRWRAETFHTEEPMMVDWLKTFTDRDVFLDVGANVGTYSVPAAQRARQVIAVELDPANVYCLSANICMNNLQSKVVIVPIASSEKKSIQEIFYRDFSMGDALQSVGREQILPTKKPAPYSIRQLTMPIDSLFNEYDLLQPTKIKIDVDGNEKIVLEGAWNTISKASEVYFEDNGLDSDSEILEKFFDCGFVITRETPSNVGSVKSDISRNLLLSKKA